MPYFMPPNEILSLSTNTGMMTYTSTAAQPVLLRVVYLLMQHVYLGTPASLPYKFLRAPMIATPCCSPLCATAAPHQKLSCVGKPQTLKALSFPSKLLLMIREIHQACFTLRALWKRMGLVRRLAAMRLSASATFCCRCFWNGSKPASGSHFQRISPR